MGALQKAFGPRSSMSAKRDGIWGEIIDALTECQSLDDVRAFEAWIAVKHWNLPRPYAEPLADAVEDRLESIAMDDDILAGRIVTR